MFDLKGKYTGKSALLISGGPSALSNMHRLKHIDRERFVVFVESKALTKALIASGLTIDFLLAPYPEKIQDNTVYNYVYQALKVDAPIKFFIKKEFHTLVEDIKRRQGQIFEVWNPQKGPHKALKYQKNVYMPLSPMEILLEHPEISVITRPSFFHEHFPGLDMTNQFHFFEFDENDNEGGFDNYIEMREEKSGCYVRKNAFTNTAAISTFPILRYLGCEELYLFGMDGTMLGTFENNADAMFKSRLHFYLFLVRCRRALSSNLKLSFPMYLRPSKDREDLDELLCRLSEPVFRITTRDMPRATFANVEEVCISSILRAPS